MAAASKPSSFRGDYYTTEEYKELTNFLKPNCLFLQIIKSRIDKGPAAIKRAIRNVAILGATSMVYELIYKTPLSNIPLYLNTENHYNTSTCQWRFHINK